jgi:hypothetical protein
MQKKIFYNIFLIVALLTFLNFSVHSMNEGDMGFYAGLFGLISIPFIAYNLWSN